MCVETISLLRELAAWKLSYLRNQQVVASLLGDKQLASKKFRAMMLLGKAVKRIA